MNYHILKGWHYSLPFWMWVWWRKKTFAWIVTFTDSCRYDLQDVDQGDTNKLCGFGFLPGHHTNSARFGWRYLVDVDRIELSAYVYENRVRTIQPIAVCELNKEYKLGLAHVSDIGTYAFTCKQGYSLHGYITVTTSHKKKFKYRLGPYFGGNKKAPHTIHIQFKRI